MVYTIKLDLDIYEDDISDDVKIKKFLEECLNSGVSNVSGIEILDMNN